MKADTKSRPRKLNWLSKLGLIVALLAFFPAVFLVLGDTFSGFENPYIAVITYMVLPVVCGLGLFLAAVGGLLRLRKRGKEHDEPIFPVIDLNSRIIRKRFVVVSLVLLLLLGIASLGGYRALHFVESNEFCGVVCHSVMKPEYATFQKSPHAGSACVVCHVGSGAKWFIKTKIGGMRELYALITDRFHRPISTPIGNLRSTDETCSECHWERKDFGFVLRTWHHFLADDDNPPWTILMRMNLGGGDPDKGPVTGIHWHVNGGKVEYIASDEKRMVIPWIRVTNEDGTETVYTTQDESEALTDEQIATMPIRPMDCTDCHNRPTHQFLSPNRGVDEALADGSLDRELSYIKEFAADLLAGEYKTQDAARQRIADAMREEYPDHPELDRNIEVLQTLYSQNFFPSMNVRWDAYPDHIGHKITPGCLRCHDGKHQDETGRPVVHDCDACHTILAQGATDELGEFSGDPQEFEHPVDIGDDWKTERCDDCHTGAP